MNDVRHRTVVGALCATLAFAPAWSVRAQTEPASSATDPQAAPVDQAPATTESNTVDDEARRAASTHFRMGVALFEEGDFQAALAEFEQAFAAAPSHVVLYNIAQTHLALRDYVAATDALQRYLELGAERISDARRAEVAAQLETLAARVGRLHFECNVDGAVVTIDGRVVGETPFTDPVRVSSGRHNVVVRAPGRDPDERTITIAGNTDTTISVEFAPLPTLAPVVVAEPARPMRALGSSGIAIGSAAGAAAFVTFGLTYRARNVYDDAVSTIPSDEETARDARDDVRRFALATDVLGGVGAAVGGVGLILQQIDRRRHADDEDEGVQAVVLPTASGLRIVGTF